MITKSGIYVAGPMRGRLNHNIQAFKDAERNLRNVGFRHVRTPLECAEVGIREKWTPADFMRWDLRIVTEVEAVVVLPGGHLSRGTSQEVVVARDFLELLVVDLDYALVAGPQILGLKGYDPKDFEHAPPPPPKPNPRIVGKPRDF